MKQQRASELHQLSLPELRSLLEETQRALTVEKVKVQAGKSKGGSIARMADQLARILTIIREKELTA